jgi:cell division protein FtsI/penicillin-binding protein 2
VNRRRLQVVALTLAAGVAAVAMRAVQVTVVQHETWAAEARKQHEKLVPAAGPRGEIRSADGYVLATSVPRVALQVGTDNLEVPTAFARAAAPLLGVDEGTLIERLVDGPRWVLLAKGLEPETAESVRELAPGAVGLLPDTERLYPHGSLAAPLLGFVGREEREVVGRSGFEHHYDDLLAGEPDTYLVRRDGIPRRLAVEKVRAGRSGYDFELTLLARLQAVCEAELERVIRDEGADGGSVVVMEADTGNLLAVASAPSFDPSDPPSNPARWLLRPVQGALEPGSTVKPMVAAAALAAGSVRESDRFDCLRKGISVEGRWIRDHADPGIYTLPEVIAVSANAGIIEVAHRTPPEALWRALSAFGFGRATGVGLPAEASGILQPPAQWSRMSRSGLALGQELTTSPLQVAVAYAAVANGGWLVRPRLVAGAVGSDRGLRGDGVVRTRVLDERLAATVRGWLERVIDEGTGDGARVPGYRVAGKTGTAQRAVGGRFDDTHHTSWFAGFLPAESPRLVIVVAVENPRGDFWASTVAAPVFSRIGEQAAALLAIPPSDPDRASVRVARLDDGREGPA